MLLKKKWISRIKVFRNALQNQILFYNIKKKTKPEKRKKKTG